VTKKTRMVTLKDGQKIEVAKPDAAKDREVILRAGANICYIDHNTGDSDHMNAHIRTSKCR
jgi:hypothetical protein